MEYLEGHTLAQRLEAEPLPTHEVLAIGLQIGEALEYAHQKGVIHRDLKPGNVMMTAEGAKLLDFGLARRTAVEGKSQQEKTDLTETGAIAGTVAYMSPEQAQGLPIGPQSDIFSLGSFCSKWRPASVLFKERPALQHLLSY
jgi:eukaryotic-like serine/threonine-protein kinase